MSVFALWAGCGFAMITGLGLYQTVQTFDIMGKYYVGFNKFTPLVNAGISMFLLFVCLGKTRTNLVGHGVGLHIHQFVDRTICQCMIRKSHRRIDCGPWL